MICLVSALLEDLTVLFERVGDKETRWWLLCGVGEKRDRGGIEIFEIVEEGLLRRTFIDFEGFRVFVHYPRIKRGSTFNP